MHTETLLGMADVKVNVVFIERLPWNKRKTPTKLQLLFRNKKFYRVIWLDQVTLKTNEYEQVHYCYCNLSMRSFRIVTSMKSI